MVRRNGWQRSRFVGPARAGASPRAAFCEGFHCHCPVGPGCGGFHGRCSGFPLAAADRGRTPRAGTGRAVYAAFSRSIRSYTTRGEDAAATKRARTGQTGSGLWPDRRPGCGLALHCRRHLCPGEGILPLFRRRPPRPVRLFGNWHISSRKSPTRSLNVECALCSRNGNAKVAAGLLVGLPCCYTEAAGLRRAVHAG